MATEEYLEKLVNAIPCNDGVPKVEDLRAHVIKLVKSGNGPPAIVDPSAPKIDVLIIGDENCSNYFRFFSMNYFIIRRSDRTNNASMIDFNDFLTGMGMDISTSELHYVWRNNTLKVNIHVGQANIDRALYDIGIQMLLRYMQEGLIDRVFSPFYRDENNTLFSISQVPDRLPMVRNAEITAEKYEELVWQRFEHEKGQLNMCDFENQREYHKEVVNLYSNAKKRITLLTLKSKLLENANRMVSRKIVVSRQKADGYGDCPFLSLPAEIHTNILQFLQCRLNGVCLLLKLSNSLDFGDLLRFRVVSKSCNKIFCDAFHSSIVKKPSHFAEYLRDDSSTANEDHSGIDEGSEEKQVRFHYFDDLFEGISPREVVKTFNELLSDEERDTFDRKEIEISREELKGEMKCICRASYNAFF
ncbi:predicted protein [Chaetoceros tenuissimus]|uniref:Uncharacterized protein n=1 Tax=Chaetoceros tenuissimus TaxID=426638 RepID=A0AAD3HAB1_9STRA|nr:predicted protein [Chaetoceros tenuissimus]